MRASSLLVLILSWCKIASSEQVHPRHHKALAYVVQGSKASMGGWLELQRNLSRYAHDVDFFILTYDDNLDEEQCAHVPATASTKDLRTYCLHAPHTTWTEGRNLLVRQVGLTEWKREHQYKYWVMLDEDAISPYCDLKHECERDCCFDHLNQLLLAPAVNYASVGCLSAPMKKPYRYDQDIVYFSDCVDACMHAIHRDAVPILLPYIDYIDFSSWWESQALLFHAVSHCLPGTGVMYPHFRCSNDQHSEYPRGRVFPLEQTALETVFTSYPGSGILDIPFRKMMPGDCANVRKFYENVASAVLPNSMDGTETLPQHTAVYGGVWQKSERYQQCLAPFLHRFKDHLMGSMEKKVFVREEGAVSQYAYSFTVSETDADVEAETEKNNRTTTGAVTSTVAAASTGESLLLRNGDIVRLATFEGSTAGNELQQRKQQHEDEEEEQEPAEVYSKIYVILGGQKHLVPDKVTFEAMGIPIGKLKFLSKAEFESVPTGSALWKEPIFPPERTKSTFFLSNLSFFLLIIVMICVVVVFFMWKNRSNYLQRKQYGYAKLTLRK